MTRWIAIIAILVTSMPESSAVDGDVTLTLSVTKRPDKLVRLSGTTNLPPGTKLVVGVEEKMENGYLAQQSCSVSGDGTFQSKVFGPLGGIKDGRYEAAATMPIPAVQSTEVKQVIGTKGENLTGPLVEKHQFGATVARTLEFAIGDNPDAAQAKRIAEAKAATAALKHRVCVLLEELLEFKDRPKFKEFGFAIGGPYNEWLKSVEDLRDSTPTGLRHPIPLHVRTAPGDLLILGMDYALEGETKFIRVRLPEVKKTIDFSAYLDDKNQPSRESDLRTWRDSTGRFSVDAKLVRKTKTHVVLRKTDGTTVSVPFSRLSSADQEFAARQAAQ